MGQTFPRGAKFEAPITFAAVPAGLYQVALPLWEEGRTNDGTKLKYDSSIGMRIVAVKKVLDGKYQGDPSTLTGMSIYAHNDFIIGPVDGASGELLDPEDWLKNGGGRGGPRFNNMIEAAGIEAGDDVDEICQLLEGREVVVQVNVESGVDNGAGGRYPDKNRIVKFYPAHLMAAAPAKSTQAAPTPTPARAVAAAAQPARMTPARTAAPARAATPMRSATADPLVLCDVCELEGKAVEVPRSGFAKHLREQHPENP